VRDAEEFGQDNAGLTEAEVVRLETGEDQVGRLGLDGVSKDLGYAESVAPAEVVGLDVDGAIGSLGEGLTQGAGDAFGTGADDDDLAPVLLLELKRLFKRISVGFVNGVAEVALVDSLAVTGDADRSIALGNLFNSDHNFH